MKQVTINLDDAILERAEQLARERGMSVDQLLGSLLVRATAGTETKNAHRARMALVELARSSHRGMMGEWNRENAYADRLSRYERADLRGDGGDDSSSQVGDGGRDHGAE